MCSPRVTWWENPRLESGKSRKLMGSSLIWYENGLVWKENGNAFPNRCWFLTCSLLFSAIVVLFVVVRKVLRFTKSVNDVYSFRLCIIPVDLWGPDLSRFYRKGEKEEEKKPFNIYSILASNYSWNSRNRTVYKFSPPLSTKADITTYLNNTLLYKLINENVWLMQNFSVSSFCQHSISKLTSPATVFEIINK